MKAFMALRQLLQVFGGMDMAWWNGVLTGCVCLTLALLSYWKSTHLLGLPFFLGTTTILLGGGLVLLGHEH